MFLCCCESSAANHFNNITCSKAHSIRRRTLHSCKVRSLAKDDYWFCHVRVRQSVHQHVPLPLFPRTKFPELSYFGFWLHIVHTSRFWLISDKYNSHWTFMISRWLFFVTETGLILCKVWAKDEKQLRIKHHLWLKVLPVRHTLRLKMQSSRLTIIRCSPILHLSTGYGEILSCLSLSENYFRATAERKCLKCSAHRTFPYSLLHVTSLN